MNTAIDVKTEEMPNKLHDTKILKLLITSLFG